MRSAWFIDLRGLRKCCSALSESRRCSMPMTNYSAFGKVFMICCNRLASLREALAEQKRTWNRSEQRVLLLKKSAAQANLKGKLAARAENKKSQKEVAKVIAEGSSSENGSSSATKKAAPEGQPEKAKSIDPITETTEFYLRHIVEMVENFRSNARKSNANAEHVEWLAESCRSFVLSSLQGTANAQKVATIMVKQKGSAFATLYTHLRSGGDVTLAMELVTICQRHRVNKSDGPMPTREGLDVNIDAYGPRPIHLAAMFGRADIIERMMLCPYGHNNYYDSICDRVTECEFTALHLAACCTDGAAAILALGAHRCGKIDARSIPFSKSPLHLASERGYVANMEALISIGANVNKYAFSAGFGSRYTFFPLQLSIENGHLEAVKLLLEKGAAATVPKESLQWSDSKETFLSLAAAKGHVDIFKLLLSKGASPTGRELFSACRSGHKEIADLLLPEGIYVSCTDDKGYTALAFAIVRGWADTARWLIINGGKDLSVEFKDGRTALNAAIMHNQRETALLLIDKGAAIITTKYQDGSIESPLHLAAKNGDLEMVKRLVARGALTSCFDKYDKTPPCVLAAGTEAFSFLLKETLAVVRNERSSDYLTKQISRARSRMVYDFLSWGGMEVRYSNKYSNQDEDDKYSGTLLHWASKTFNDAAANIALLIAEGAKLDSAAAAFGDTPLHTAARFGNLSAIEALIRHGASIRAEADNGWSPLHTAAAEAKTEAVKMLLSLGADRNAVCKAGKTPLEVHLAGRPRRLLSKEEADEIVSLLS